MVTKGIIVRLKAKSGQEETVAGFLRDAGSKNETSVDGQRVSEIKLVGGESLRVGSTELLFEVRPRNATPGWADPLEPPEPVEKNNLALSVRDRRHYRVQELPRDLGEAIDLMKRSSFMRRSLGDHVFKHYIAAKEAEWRDYIVQVHDWEVERYLASY